jgi:hypothetical protein
MTVISRNQREHSGRQLNRDGEEMHILDRLSEYVVAFDHWWPLHRTTIHSIKPGFSGDQVLSTIGASAIPITQSISAMGTMFQTQV